MKPYNRRADVAFLKQANEMSELAKKALLPLVGTLTAAGAAGLYGYISAKRSGEQHHKDLAASLAKAMSVSPQFKSDPQRFTTLFSELAVLSPTVAKNPAMAGKLIAQKFKGGFELDDVHKLSVIEHAATTKKGLPTAGAAARGAAGAATGAILSTFGDKLFDHYYNLKEEHKKLLKSRDPLATDAAKSFAEALKAGAKLDPLPRSQTDKDNLAELFAKIDAMKKESSVADITAYPLMVSERCLGLMLSDRYQMLKTSAAAQPSAFRRGLEAMRSNLEFMAPAAALAGGVGLVKLVYNHMQNQKLKSEADRHFAELMKTSPLLQSDPNVAKQSFESLKTFAPALAARPQVMKTFVENQVQVGGMLPVDQVRLLAETSGIVSRQAGHGFGSSIRDTVKFVLPGRGDGDDEMASMHREIGLLKGKAELERLRSSGQKSGS